MRRHLLGGKRHVSNIFTKLNVAERARAIERAREAGPGRQSTKP